MGKPGRKRKALYMKWTDATVSSEVEVVEIAKTKVTCPACETYATSQATKPVAVMCCEGGCARGEIARRAANLLCFKLAPEKTARICLGGAFTKDTGQRRLVREAGRVIAIEGCFIRCATRMMVGVVPELNPEVVLADDHYDLDPIPFGINELSEADAERCASRVAGRIAGTL